MARVILPIAALAAIGAVLVGGFVAITKLERSAVEGVADIDAVGVPVHEARPSNLRSDESVIFFPTVGRMSDDGERWVVPIHAWVFEPEDGAFFRGLLIDELADELDLDEDEVADGIFRERVAWFLVDNERNKRLTLVTSDRAVELPGTTGSEGHLLATIEVPAESGHDGLLRYGALAPDGSQAKIVEGYTRLLSPTGLTVISDIDDTVKVSYVTDKRKLLRKTFAEPFEAAPGMAERYQRIAKDEPGAAFIYVSSSPWQLYPVLSQGLSDAGFPAPAAYHLKTFRAKDSRVLDLIADPLAAKTTKIESIIVDHPQRDYILSGDTGERDPEVYAAIAAGYPDRVKRILLRNVTDETLDNERLAALFGELDVPVELIDPE